MTWYTQLPWAEAGPQVEKDAEKFPLPKCFTLLLGHFTITPRRQLKDQPTPHRPIAHPSWQAIHGLVVTLLSILPRRAGREDQAVSQQGRCRTPILLASSLLQNSNLHWLFLSFLHPGLATWSNKVENYLYFNHHETPGEKCMEGGHTPPFLPKLQVLSEGAPQTGGLWKLTGSGQGEGEGRWNRVLTTYDDNLVSNNDSWCTNILHYSGLHTKPRIPGDMVNLMKK